MRSGGHGHGDGHGHGAPKDNVDLLSQMGYENRDISFNTVAWSVVFLFGFAFVISLITLGIYNFFVPTKVEQERVSPLMSVRRVPPYPQLQAAPKRDMIEFRQAEDAVLTGANKGADGHTSIPIDQAMNAISARGISGVSGTKTRPESISYPGSGDFSGGPDAANNNGSGDMTDYAPTTALHEGEPGAGGIGAVNGEGKPAPVEPDQSAPISGPSDAVATPKAPTLPGAPVGEGTSNPANRNNGIPNR